MIPDLNDDWILLEFSQIEFEASGYLRVELDLYLPVRGQNDVEVTRIYDSAQLIESLFDAIICFLQ